MRMVPLAADPWNTGRYAASRGIAELCDRWGVQRLRHSKAGRGDGPVEEREHDEVEHDRRDHFMRAEPRPQHAGNRSPPSPPPIIAASRHIGMASHGGMPAGSSKPSAPAQNPPAASWLSAPMLNRPARKSDRNTQVR